MYRNQSGGVKNEDLSIYLYDGERMMLMEEYLNGNTDICEEENNKNMYIHRRLFVVRYIILFLEYFTYILLLDFTENEKSSTLYLLFSSCRSR